MSAFAIGVRALILFFMLDPRLALAHETCDELRLLDRTDTHAIPKLIPASAPLTEIEKVRAELRKVEPILTPMGKKVQIDWSGIEEQVIGRSKNLGEPPSRLRELTTSIWVNGIETYTKLPFGTPSKVLECRPNCQVNYYVEYKRGDAVVHRSSFGLLETKDGQQLAGGSFDNRYAGELFGVNYGSTFSPSMPAAELTQSAVRLSYKKIVWVIKPGASDLTRRFIDNAENGVDVHAHFGSEGAPTSVRIVDRKTKASITAPPSDFIFKLDAAFSGHSFFWDDMIVALSTVAHHPWLVRSTIEFWLMVQEQNGGVIPREVLKSNLRSLFFPDKIVYGDKKSEANLVFTNPYLMNWVIDELYRHDPSAENLALLKRVYKSVEDYTRWMETHRAVKDGNQIIGFNGSALGTGADNSRGRIGNRNEPDAYNSGLIDFMAQQIQMYKDLARWSRLITEADTNLTAAERMRLGSKAAAATAKAQQFTQVMNRMYWNPERCFYYDLIPNDSGGWQHNLNYTVVGGFWPVWAGVPTQEQLNCMIEKQMTPQTFGGFPFPANARNSIGQFKDPLYVPRPGNEEDGYWDKWAHWPPMVMMATEGFRRMGRLDLAYQYALEFLKKTAQWSTKTVEESLGEIMKVHDDGSITFEARAIQHSDHMHREDFAGWGKGPPVYMLLTHILGLRPNYKGKLDWNLMVPLDVGQFIEIKNLQYMGHTVRSLKVQRTAQGYELIADSDGPIVLELNIMRDQNGQLMNTPLVRSGVISIPAGGRKWQASL